MRYRPAPFVLCAAFAFLVAGCHVKPGSDPVLVNSERAGDVSLDVVDAFLKVESDNHEYLKAHAPAVTAAANDIRRRFPAAWSDYRLALDSYRSTKSPTDQMTLEDRLNQLSSLATLAREQLAQAQKVNP